MYEYYELFDRTPIFFSALCFRKNLSLINPSDPSASDAGYGLVLVVGESYIRIICSRYGRYAYYPLWGKLYMGEKAKLLWYKEEDLHNTVSFDEFKDLFTQAATYFAITGNPGEIWTHKLDELFSKLEDEYRKIPEEYLTLGAWR